MNTKKIAVFLLALLLPALAWAAVTGIPSRPTFGLVNVVSDINTMPTDGSGSADSGFVVRLKDGQASPSSMIIVANTGGVPANPAATLRIGVRSGGLNYRRWGVRKNSDAESGANVGSDFEIESFDDAGNHLEFPVKIMRSTGNFILQQGTFSSTRSCAAGYTRISPNLCWRSQLVSMGAITDNTCTTIAAPTGALQVYYLVNIAAVSQNAVGLRTSRASSYTAAACATQYDTNVAEAYEHVAVAAGNVLSQGLPTLRAPVVSGNFYIKTVLNAASVGFPAGGIVGYQD